MTLPRPRPATLIVLLILIAAGLGLVWQLNERPRAPTPTPNPTPAPVSPPAVDMTGLYKGPPVVESVAEPDRRAIYKLWRSLDAEVAATNPEFPEDAYALQRERFAARLAAEPIGGRAELEPSTLDLIVFEGDRRRWPTGDGD
jgi:hypothetical protein